jgi:hypothetical protein
MLVDVVDTLGELGVMTVWLVTADVPAPPVAPPDTDPVEPLAPVPPVVAGGVVLSANATPAREVYASMVALTIESLLGRIERSP